MKGPLAVGSVHQYLIGLDTRECGPSAPDR